jgi:hypothetical protein
MQAQLPAPHTGKGFIARREDVAALNSSIALTMGSAEAVV